MRKHAHQLSGYVWQELTGNVHHLTFRLTRLEVFWDNDRKGFGFEVQGFKRFRSKDVWASLDVAKSEALKKLDRLVQAESNKIQATVSEFVPF